MLSEPLGMIVIMSNISEKKGYLVGADISFGIRNVEVKNTNKIIEKARARIYFIIFCFIVVFLIVAVRLFELSVYKKPVYLSSPLELNPLAIKMQRSDIIDRNGDIIATSLPVVNFSANPQQVRDKVKVATEIANIFPDLTVDEVLTKLNSKRRFVYIKRNITPKEQFAVNKLGNPALGFQKAEYRVYPQGNLFSHALGFVDVDNKGIAGLELFYDKELSSSAKPLQVSLDMRVQQVVRSQLLEAMEVFGATSAIGAVMNVNNGEVIAMVSLPDFDPNKYQDSPKENYFNKASLGVYEVGSVFKLFNTAMSLESGKVKVTDKFDATKPLVMSSHRITDFSAKNRWLDVEEIMVYSSNIGSAKMALSVGADFQKQFLSKIGFFDDLEIELKERATPLIPEVWRDINVATISYGYGLAVSPLHVLRAMSAMINGGRLYPLTLRLTNDTLSYRQVLSSETSSILRDLTRKVVTKGSAKMANISGYLVGGKTGSAQIRENGKYVSGRLRTSFIGAFPIDNPKYSIIVTLTDPKRIAGTYGNTAGWNATPTAGKIIERIVPMLGIEPSIVYKNTVTKNIIKAQFANDR